MRAHRPTLECGSYCGRAPSVPGRRASTRAVPGPSDMTAPAPSARGSRRNLGRQRRGHSRVRRPRRTDVGRRLPSTVPRRSALAGRQACLASRPRVAPSARISSGHPPRPPGRRTPGPGPGPGSSRQSQPACPGPRQRETHGGEIDPWSVSLGGTPVETVRFSWPRFPAYISPNARPLHDFPRRHRRAEINSCAGTARPGRARRGVEVPRRPPPPAGTSLAAPRASGRYRGRAGG